MLDLLFTNPLVFFVWLLALITAITIHEFAHAWAATRLGDPTPRLQGRLTLNPLAHMDPLGTLMLLIARFGWGKPVQFDPFNLENPKRDAALISLAGPVSNLILASILAIFLRLGSGPFSSMSFVTSLLPPFIFLNVILAVFNLLPIHPLDGGKILVGILPPKDAVQMDRFMAQYGIFILILLIFPLWGGVAPVSYLLSPVINIILSILIPSGNMI